PAGPSGVRGQQTLHPRSAAAQGHPEQSARRPQGDRTVITPNADRDPVEQLAEEFAERYRRGERPSLSEYTRKYPEQAEESRELFPPVVLREAFGPAGPPAPGPFLPRGAGGAPPAQLGEFRILREVGHGGMGVDYEAVQESLGRHVALKILPFHKLINPTHL